MIILSPIKRRGKLTKKRKSETAKSDPEGVGPNYGIDRLNIGKSKHDSDE